MRKKRTLTIALIYGSVCLSTALEELSKKPGIDTQSAYSVAQGILEGVSEQAMREIDAMLAPSE